MRRVVLLLLLAPAGAQDGGPGPDSLFRAAIAHVEKAEYAEAAEALTEALPYFEKANEPQALAMTLLLRGFCLDRLGRYGEALVDHERVREIHARTATGDREDVATALGQLGICLLRLGRGEEALGRLEEARAMHERLAKGKDSPAVAKALGSTTLCLLQLGRPREALAVAQASVAMQRRLQADGGPAVAAALDNLANCLDDLGRHAEALEARLESLALLRQSGQDDGEEVATTLVNIGYTLQLLGRAEDARSPLEEALAIRLRLHEGDHVEVAVALNNLAVCVGNVGRHEEALKLVDRALAMTRRLFPGDHPRVAQLAYSRGAANVDLGRVKEALADFDEALAMRRRLYDGDNEEILSALDERGKCLEKLGRTEEAEAAFREALEMARRLDSLRAHVCAADLATLLLRDLGKPAEAVPLFEEAISCIEELRGAAMGLTESDRATYFETLSRFRAFDGMVRAQLALGHPEEALRYLERGRARSFLDLLARSRIDPVEEIRRESAGDEKAIAALDEIVSALDRAERESRRLGQALEATGARRDLPREEQRGLLHKLRAECAQAEQARREALRRRAWLVRSRLEVAATGDAAEIQRMLGPDERLLVYSINDEDGVLLLVPPAGSAIRGFPLEGPSGAPLDGASLRELVDSYRAAVFSGEAQHGDPVAQGLALFRAVVPAAAWESLRKVRRIHVVPHGALHRLPFEALVVEAGKEPRYWIDEGPEIAYGPSGSALLWCRKRRDGQREQEPLRDVVALGDPVFGRSESGPYRTLVALPGTRLEVEAIREELAPAPVLTLLGEQATERALFDAAPRARYLHVATHQVAAEAERVSYSGLALAAPAVPAADDDGYLSLADLFERWRGRLGRCELVVLSACETQVGRELKDEGVYALPWGFQFAGAPAVIASLWRVDDESAADLFRDFYRRLAKGSDKLSAFAGARKALRAAKPQPRFWAPFIYIGDPR